MSPIALFILVVSSFALLLAVHALSCVVLAKHAPRWQGALAFVVPPLAPVFTARRHRIGWTVVWIAAAVLYGTCLVLARASG